MEEEIYKFTEWKDKNFHISSDKDKPYYPKVLSELFSTTKMINFEKQTKYTLIELIQYWTNKK